MWEDLYEMWCEQLGNEELTDDEYDQARDDIKELCRA